MITQAGGDYGRNLPRPCLFFVYKFAVHAFVPQCPFRVLHHPQITPFYLGSGQSALYTRVATKALILSEFMFFLESVSYLRHFTPSLLAVRDETV